MALVKFGGGITAMSGSIAGNTFARNRYGAYVRARTKPVNPNSTSQNKIRSIMAYLTEFWYEHLSNAQREAWATYATGVAMKNKLGETIKLSGFNHFIRSNSPRGMGNFALLPIIVIAPAVNGIPLKDETLTVDADAAPQKLAITFDVGRDWNQEVGGAVYFLQGRPQSPTRNFFAGPYRWSTHWRVLAPGEFASPSNIPVIFPLSIGQRVWVRVRMARADGRLSQPWQVSTVVHGASPGEVPNVIGMTQALATAAIIERQLVLGNVTEANSDTIPVGCVISSDPVAGTTLNIGDPVHVVVSLGPA